MSKKSVIDKIKKFVSHRLPEKTFEDYIIHRRGNNTDTYWTTTDWSNITVPTEEKYTDYTTTNTDKEDYSEYVTTRINTKTVKYLGQEYHIPCNIQYSRSDSSY